jgi:adenosylcobinamide-GDP ribazoletransferase
MRHALALLTVLPAGRCPLRATGTASLLGFPAVGLLLGLLWVAAAFAGLVWWSPLVAAALVVAVDAIVTGGLHLDGVADVGDVVGSRRRGAAALEVARDPNVGALGAVALACVLLLRFSLLTLLITGGGVWALLAVPVAGRAAMLHALRRCGPDERSLAHPLVAAATGPVLTTAFVGALTALVLTGPGPVRSGLAVLLVIALVEGGTRWWRHRIGQASGDLLGALGVGAELAVLLTLTAG